MKLTAVAASALVASSAIAGPWHSFASARNAESTTTAALAKTGIANVREFGLKVSVDGHPHVHGSLRCTRAGHIDFDGFDYVVQTDAIRRLAVHLGGPATCALTAIATVSGDPVPITMVAYKR